MNYRFTKYHVLCSKRGKDIVTIFCLKLSASNARVCSLICMKTYASSDLVERETVACRTQVLECVSDLSWVCRWKPFENTTHWTIQHLGKIFRWWVGVSYLNSFWYNPKQLDAQNNTVGTGKKLREKGTLENGNNYYRCILKRPIYLKQLVYWTEPVL